MIMAKENKMDTHEKAVEYVACNLIENGIVTRKPKTPEHGIDLVLDNGETILVRGLNEEITVPISHTATGNINADYAVIATNLKYTYSRRMYVISNGNIPEIANNNQIRKTGGDNWFIPAKNYRSQNEGYGVLGGVITPP